MTNHMADTTSPTLPPPTWLLVLIAVVATSAIFWVASL